MDADAENVEFPGDLRDRRVVVMGLGRFGGGVAAARYLSNRGASVIATDVADAEALGGALDQLPGLDLTLRLGGHRREDFEQADLVIVNPAVPRPWSNPYLDAARSGGARLLTEIRLAIGDRPAKHLVGITGSAGKSTTAAMVHHALRLARPDLNPRLSGNIGGSLLDDPPSPDATVVLELSSFMMHWLSGDGGQPEDRATTGIAAITNIAPNHLDWHQTLEHYEACKRSIASPSPTCPRPVLLQPSETTKPGEAAIPLLLPGGHNQENARFALRIAIEHIRLRDPESIEDGLEEDLRSALSSFEGLPHRLESLGEIRGARIFNDSKSTTPEATLLAVDAFEDPSRVHLIAGGYDKGTDLGPIAALVPRLASLQAIGATGPALEAGGAELAGRLDAAVDAIFRSVKPGDVVLLSPGCASWDQFINYEQRGAAFQEAVHRHQDG